MPGLREQIPHPASRRCDQHISPPIRSAIWDISPIYARSNIIATPSRAFTRASVCATTRWNNQSRPERRLVGNDHRGIQRDRLQCDRSSSRRKLMGTSRKSAPQPTDLKSAKSALQRPPLLRPHGSRSHRDLCGNAHRRVNESSPWDQDSVRQRRARSASSASPNISSPQSRTRPPAIRPGAATICKPPHPRWSPTTFATKPSVSPDKAQKDTPIGARAHPAGVA
jgi:hypothetical protein